MRQQVWTDLTESRRPLVVAGYSSIVELLRLAADWNEHEQAGTIRVLLGTEPFEGRPQTFGSASAKFTDEARAYWYDRGVSLRLSAKVVTAMQMVDDGRLDVRFIHGHEMLHAKAYVGDAAATTGSSNFTHSGLSRQIEVNARFDRDADRTRYDELAQIGENLWAVGIDWNAGFLDLLRHLLQVVTWQEALARACAELLDGDWARAYLDGLEAGAMPLWPSQRAGIAQALWIVENVGSVLVADATGSGKTRMGVQLLRGLRDRLWQTGRIRSDRTVIVCPPGVKDTWDHETEVGGFSSAKPVSHGSLSRASSSAAERAQARVNGAQILAVDEAHNFLSAGSNRTQFLRKNLADHVVLFTATPISRGASDLLDLVALLGPDNFDDDTHVILRSLQRGRIARSLDDAQSDQLRAEIQRFTLRRTKRQINAMVDEEPDAYEHHRTGRTCRYPTHISKAYETDETATDVAAAAEIRKLASTLRGLALLPDSMAVPSAMRRQFSDEQWLTFRLKSAAGLASHQVLAALRSSRAALHEHLLGTAAAAERFSLPTTFKATDSGDRIASTEERCVKGPPKPAANSAPPEWIRDPAEWRAACEREVATYRAIATLLEEISPAREHGKRDLLQRLAEDHPRVLAFDHYLITLAFMEQLLDASDLEVLVATGQKKGQRLRVQERFAPDAPDDARVIALCSDAMNEGLNLQGASAIVHLDLPTTLRIAEQRVGRVDRKDSPHDTIEAWWPRDGRAFATRARDRLVQRLEESRTLLGQNTPVPDLGGSRLLEELDDDALVDVEEDQQRVERALEGPRDDLADALEPVRGLVTGSTALVTRAEYDRQRHATHRVMARVAPVAASHAWAFLAVRTSVHGAPRWMFVEPTKGDRCSTVLGDVATRLRDHLEGLPTSAPMDDRATTWLERCLDVASRAETDLLPRRLQRALRQMRRVTSAWATTARRRHDESLG